MGKFIDQMDEDIIELDSAASPTTSIIPFKESDKFVGRRVHVLFAEDGDGSGDTEYSFYKGIIQSRKSKSVFHVVFHDGDELDVDVIAGKDVVLWETGDITMGGRWSSTDDEVLDIVGTGAQVKSPRIQREKKDWWVVQRDEESQKDSSTGADKAKVRDQDVRTPGNKNPDTLKRIVSAESVGERAAARVALQEGDETPRDKSRNGSALGSPRSADRVKSPAIQHANRLQSITPQQKQGEYGELRESINVRGKEFLRALMGLQTAVANLNTLNNSIKVFMHKSESNAEQISGIARTARGFINQVLKPTGGVKSTGGMTLEKVWPLNDLVMDSVSSLHATTSVLCQKANQPVATDGGVLENWKSSKQQGNRPQANTMPPPPQQMTDKGKHQEQDQQREQAPGQIKEENLLPSQDKKREREHAVPQKPPKQAKKESSKLNLFPPTGSKVRDNALRILAHSLMCPVATPHEIAVDLETAIFEKFPPGEDGTYPEDYYRSVMGARELLNLDSQHCRRGLRLMIMDGVISPVEFLASSPDDLNEKLAAFKNRIEGEKPIGVRE
jgi:hypothetical protein